MWLKISSFILKLLAHLVHFYQSANFYKNPTKFKPRQFRPNLKPNYPKRISDYNKLFDSITLRDPDIFWKKKEIYKI